MSVTVNNEVITGNKFVKLLGVKIDKMILNVFIFLFRVCTEPKHGQLSKHSRNVAEPVPRVASSLIPFQVGLIIEVFAIALNRSKHPPTMVDSIGVPQGRGGG